jgi:Xaa-Pro aminopeptidase
MVDLEKMRKLMDGEGVNALVATSVENVYHSTGNYNALLRLLPERPSYAVFPRDGEPVYLVNTIEEDFAKRESWIKDVWTWRIGESPAEVLFDILKEKRVLDGKIALEFLALPSVFYRELSSLASETVFVEAAKIFDRLREIKESWEIDILTIGARAQRKAIEGAFALAEPGWTEKDISEIIGQRMLSAGFDEIGWRTVETGTGTLSIHELPSLRELEPGDIVRADCGGRVKGYYSDLARMAVVGKPSKKQKSIYKALVLAQKETIKNLTVGAKISDIYTVCKNTFEQNCEGKFIFPHIGHGLGVVLHDDPQMFPDNEKRLEENMIINLEPVYVDPGVATYHVEDLVLVTAEGPKVLTGKLPDEELYMIT